VQDDQYPVLVCTHGKSAPLNNCDEFSIASSHTARRYRPKDYLCSGDRFLAFYPGW